MSTNDGGPAFPTLGDDFMQVADGTWSPKSAYGMDGKPGMTLLDYFAGQATDADIQDVLDNNFAARDISRAQARYYYAAMMLRERERRMKQD